MQHVVAAHAPGPRQDIGGGVPLGMTDVQTDAGRVGEHVEDVALGPAVTTRGAERSVLVPVALPAGLDLEVVVGAHLEIDLAANDVDDLTADPDVFAVLSQMDAAGALEGSALGRDIGG